ncbi:conserved Plasmodium protein, unknown function [Babesia microti strain RI]|uniref:Uncharacterized protein n=1 Tax=Babesia microti (strain RI) TaxID=1133968 RepID=A0A1R4AAM9_BABMR|nr:conserved Plasmodium protein, unknown function [Babesia microti strain RI]SJK86053.1 conserved Plasmodium protein, unknown function [Babesia microti strain RI]|eukprot:XP_021338250.1 conserved Plasmodium protein, unknown function [Babesia microti strain RI]
MKLLHITHFIYSINFALCITPLSLLPSSSVLYPFDFQNTWQASKPVPIVINYSVSKFGPNDELVERNEIINQ